MARELKFCGPRKGPCFEVSFRFSKDLFNLPLVASELSNPQSLTHVAVAHGPIWLFPFVPEVLHDCTSLLYIIRKIINVKEKLGVLFSCNFLTTTFKNSLEKSY